MKAEIAKPTTTDKYEIYVDYAFGASLKLFMGSTLPSAALGATAGNGVSYSSLVYSGSNVNTVWLVSIPNIDGNPVSDI